MNVVSSSEPPLRVNAPSGPPVWREVQHFRQWWMWLVVLAVAAFMWVGVVQQIVLRNPYGSKPMPDALLLVFTVVFGIGLPAFFLVLRLVTEVHTDQLRVGLAPFRRRGISLREIAVAEAVTYRPLMEYGGWGIRYAGSRGMAYNVSGNRGVQLVLADGRKVLVGSQRPEDLVAALRSTTGRTLQNPHVSAGTS